MTWKKNLVALRSLRSEHHAHNIEPNIINVTWYLGKRCNYDCSYCAPTVHDWVSPHHSLENIKNFVTQINNWAISKNKTFNMSFTGGEPFIHPDIIKILEITKQASAFGDHLVAITNGSLPLELYKQSLDYLTNLTISLHLERPDSETQATLDKIVILHHEHPDRWINVQVMCLPGKFDFIKTTVIPLLESNDIKFTLRRIRPWLNEAVDEWQTLPKKEILKIKYTQEEQTKNKGAEKYKLDQKLAQIYNSEDYYTTEELAWLRESIPTTTWQNVGIWNEDLTYFETNSDLMSSNNRNRFIGWTCFVGVDSLFIEMDGSVYRALCYNDPPIGRLGEKINFPTTPTSCKKQWCLSNIDTTVRKSHPDFLHLITKP